MHDDPGQSPETALSDEIEGLLSRLIAEHELVAGAIDEKTFDEFLKQFRRESYKKINEYARSKDL